MEAPVSSHIGWSDSALASVEDFSSVLFALGGSALQTGTPAHADGGPQMTDDGLPMSSSPQLVAPQADPTAGPVDAPVVAPGEFMLQPLTPPEGATSSSENGQGASNAEQSDQGGFQGDDLQFESYMFDQGAATPGVKASGPLPFWLRNTGDLEAQPVSDYMNMLGVAGGAGAVAEGGGDEADNDPYEDLYADLPPIEPFDFSAVRSPNEVDLEDDQLGFSVGELSGFTMPERNLMTATTDLEAVAHMLGGETDPTASDVAVVGAVGAMAVENSAVEGTTEEVKAEAPAYSEPVLAEPIEVTPIEPPMLGEVETVHLETPQAEEQARSEAPMAPGSWTAMMTSNLPGSGGDQPSPTPDMVTQDMMTPDVMTGQMSAADLDMEDLGITPFSYSELGLDSEDIATEHLPSGSLSSGRFRTTGPLGMQRERGPHNTGPLGAAPNGEAEAGEQGANGRKWPTSWLGDGGEGPTPAQQQAMNVSMLGEVMAEEDAVDTQESDPVDMAHDGGLSEEDLATMTLAAVAAPTEEPETEQEQAQQPQKKSFQTGYLGEEVEEPLTPEQAAPVMPELRMESAEPLEEVTPFTSMSELESDSQLPAIEPVGWNSEGEAQDMSTYTEAGYGVDESVAEKAQVQPKANGPAAASPVAGGYLSSGPLPELEGFDHLREMAQQHPDDLGAQMALAAAYAQRGDMATELRVYRRVLRKSNVSSKLMNVINEELADCEDEMSGHPQFHQARGDLLMRQGRFQEAIDEYNKLV
jgi:hypothetical protein